MKTPWKISLLLLVGVLTVIATIWCCHGRQEKYLSPQEKEAMEYLPGYSFLFEGEQIEIRRRWTYKAFLSQHRMVPFLEEMVPRMKRWNWTKDRPPIEVTETESTIVVIIPRWPPIPPGELWYEYGFCSKVTFDKATGDIISAWSGG